MTTRMEIIVAVVLTFVGGVFALGAVWYEHYLEATDKPVEVAQPSTTVANKEVATNKKTAETANEATVNVQQLSQLIEAAANGEKLAQYQLAQLYEKGKEGIKPDINQAIKWYQKAAEQGDVKSQLSLGRIFSKSKEIRPDFVQAAQWFTKAAEQGDASAQYFLAQLYEGGKGVEKNPIMAEQWYRKAADQGYQKAKEKLTPPVQPNN